MHLPPVPTPAQRFACIAALALCVAAPALRATEFADLKRQEPVPAGQPIPIIDFARPYLFSNVQLNYTGTQIGAIVPDADDHTGLVTYNPTTLSLDGVGTHQGDTDITNFMWLDGDKLAYVISYRKIGGVGLFESEAGKLSDAERITVDSPASSIALIGTVPEDRSQILVNLKGPELRYDHPETINAVNHGALETRYPELKTDHGFNLAFFPDKLSKIAFGVTQQDGMLTLSKLQGDTWVKCPEDLEEIDVIGAGDNPGEIVVLGQRDGTAPRPLEFMDAETGTPKDVIVQDKGYDFDGWLFRDPSSHNIVGAIYNRAAPRVVWFTEAYRNLQKAVDKLFPDQVVRIQAIDDSGKVILISSGSDRQPAVYSWVNLEKHTSGLIKNSAPWIDPKRMQPMGVIRYTNLDGKQLDAYLTLPVGTSKAHPAPMVVIPPDLPQRWTWGYDPEVQFLVSRGYAVLQPNTRGSVGYSWLYPEQERWDFRKMTDDVSMATKRAIKMGLIDPKRIAIMGYGFGGYLAVAGSTFEPGLYKCALSISAFYDWGKYISERKYAQYNDPTYSRYLYKLGDPSKNPEKYKEMSPLLYPSQLHSALLIAWGEYDDPELISQSKDMASAARGNGQNVETLSFLDEAYGVRHLEHKIELYEHVEAFLQKNL